MFIQELWRPKIGWDKELDDEQKSTWRKLQVDLQNVTKCKLERQVALNAFIRVHALNDASMKAYESVIYAATGSEVDSIMAKGRTTPTKCPTLPQLELTAANLTARLVNYVMKAYQPMVDNASVFCCTNSNIVLQWLQTEKH